MSTTQRQDLTLGAAVSALGNGFFYALAAGLYVLTTGQGTLEGLIFSWMGGFCAASALVGLPFLIWRRNRGAAVGWVFGLAAVQVCAICGGVALGLSGFVTLPG